MTWDAIWEAMEDLSLVKIGTNGGRVEILTDSTDEQRNIMKMLGFTPPRGFRNYSQTDQNL